MIARAATTVLALAWLMLGSQTASAQVRGVSYTLTPVLEGMFFEDQAALKNAVLFGGRIGFGFGELIELDGVYLFGSNSGTDLGALSGFDEATTDLLRGLPSREVAIHRFGSDLKFNIGRGGVFPFVTAGAGVMRFVPDGLNSSRAVYFSGGMGVQFSYKSRYTVVAQAKSILYRYNPSAAFMSAEDLESTGLTPDDFTTTSVNNFSASVGVQFYLGGRSGGELSELDRALQEQLRGGLRGIALRVEPVAAQVDFNEALGLRENQRFLGASLGLDLSSVVGLRGFYWLGATEDSWVDFDDLQAYGLELKLGFNEAGGSIVPYFTIGGGYLDVRHGYQGNGVTEPDDGPFAFGGVGALVPIGDAVGLEVGVRSLLMTSEGVENQSSPNTVKASTMIYGGVSFGLGRRARDAGAVFGRELAESEAGRETLSSAVSKQEADLRLAEARIDSLTRVVEEQKLLYATAAASTAAPPPDTAAVETVGRTVEGKQRAVPRTERWMNVPVPDEGEVYIRFGGSGGVSMESIDGAPWAYLYDPSTGTLTPVGASEGAPSISVAGEELRTGGAERGGKEESGTGAGAPVAQGSLTADQIRQIVREALAEEQAQGGGELRAAVQTTEAGGEAVEATPEVTRETPEVLAGAVTEETIPVGATPQAAGQFSLRPMVGYNFDEPGQALVGVRGEFRRVGRLYRLASDLVFGFGGEKTTYNLNLNGMYGLGPGVRDRAYPYAGLGVGFINLDKFELVLNIILGSDVQIRYGMVFVEYMLQDFSNNRMLAGYLVSF